jgi:transposase
MTIETLGIDIAKNVFQLHGVNRKGRGVLKRRVMRDQLLDVVAQIDPCTIVVEACTGAFTWARKFEALGHQVKIISPQYVKPFVRRQKNDGNDAEAICTAARQPHIPFVPKKTVEQQDIQALHRARQRMVNHRTAVVSQIRGLLLDRGFAFAKSITRARRLIPDILADWVGLVPRQFSSGDRNVLMGISKRGSQHLRSLLVHGARAVVRTAPNKTDPNNQWVNQLRERRGFNRATVAVANKNARIIWAVLRTGEPYRAAF